MPKQSICARCGQAGFELAEVIFPNSKFSYAAVQCLGCGAVVSVVEQGQIADALQKITVQLRQVLNHLEK